MTGRPRILAIATMRDEGPFVLEWIAHHRAVGVTGFLIFTNDCRDGTDMLLDALAEAGEVTHVRQESGDGSVQWQALKAARDHPALASADWALAIDADEFTVPKPPFDTLQDLLGALAVDAVMLPWRLFGASGQMRHADSPVTERFTRAAPEGVVFPGAARFFKTLYRVAAFDRPGVHRPKARPAAAPRWADGAGRPMPEAFARAEEVIVVPEAAAGYDAVQLNHYSLRSAEDFMVKRRRGLPNRRGKPVDLAYWAERNFNLVEDRSAARHSAARAAEAGRLLALPGVAEAHAACVTAHRAAIAEILSDPEEALFFTRLALLRTSVPPDPETGRRLLEMLRPRDGEASSGGLGR